MSTQPIAAYSFLPWARNGLGVFLKESDLDTNVKVRGSIDVTLALTTEKVSGGTATDPLPSRAVQLYGPGDVIGIDAKAIVRSEPRDWITNFETNYLPFVEFYDEDFPWRYTPAKPSPDERRLRPWITLAVLEEAEIIGEGAAGLGRPLPFIKVAQPDVVFPPPEHLWAWAHVHLNGGSSVNPNDTDAVADLLDQTVRSNRDLAYSRLLCPRILKPNTAYHAVLIPTFETGRLAGLNKNPDNAPYATACAWEDYVGKEDKQLFPYYHRFYFHTGDVGDFEYLVRLLQPRTVDPRVGRRDIDLLSPGANLPAIPELGGILRLGGALRPPLVTLSNADLLEFEKFEQWGKPYPHAFQTALANLVNLAAEYRDKTAAQANAASGIGAIATDEDPVIVPPLYGRWHAETQKLTPADGDPSRKRWVHELNLDPRHRVSSGFGTQVVQKNQEGYMEAAWQQVGKVLEGNQKIRFGQMAKFAAKVWYTRELKKIGDQSPTRFLTIASPVQRRILKDGFTVQYQMQRSALPVAAVSKTMRQALRPRARVARRIGFDNVHHPGNLLDRMNLPDGDDNKVSAAPPKVVPPGLVTEEQVADQLAPSGLPRAWLDWLTRHPWLALLLFVLGLLFALLLLAVSPVAAAAVAAVVVAVTLAIRRQMRAARAVDVLRPETRTPQSVDALPSSPDFHVGVPGQTSAPQIGGADSVEATRFKESLRNAYTVDFVERSIEIPVRKPIDLGAVARTELTALQPDRTIPARVLAGVRIPTRILEQLPENFGEVMAYPEIDAPMYEPLKGISSELFVPNLQLVQSNSITLLETNQKFIEAYMVGLNHEFARELLWREYPTDQRGSYFRQFWDVRGYLGETNSDPETLRERLRDIPELHTWSKNSGLGDHDHREAQGDKEEEVVLVIRGELLKKYPTAVIYAHRADWVRKANGDIDKTQPRKLVALSEAQALNPPRDIVKTPLYEAKVDPDLYFFGFDLTAERARGGAIVNGEEEAGWFFVIKERPGEPRFGLDLPQTAPHTINTWNDLAWSDVLNAVTPGEFLQVGEKSVTLTDPGTGSDAKEQYNEDSRFRWRADTHAAELAYILYQVPVMMAVHAAEMLKKGN